LQTNFGIRSKCADSPFQQLVIKYGYPYSYCTPSSGAKWIARVFTQYYRASHV
jgi:hypothetical protein